MAAGSIVRLKVERFMTYDSLELTPCRGLNLITGPNGTGKSSLLCAMCLGLGGKPSSIGRSERISDFIKNGYDQAVIEVELLNPNKQNIVIGRLIHSTNVSQWTLNGKQCSLKMVEKAISKFNIQTNNLCQFLPQEKVADFAKMNQKELLESTEQAVGDQSMYDNHMKLRQLRAEFCELENGLNSMKTQLERDTEKNRRLEVEIQQHKEREKQVQRIKRLERKIPWMKYEKLRSDYDANIEEKRKVTEDRERCEEQLKPLKHKINHLQQELGETRKKIELLDKEIRKKKHEFDAVQRKMGEVDSKISDMQYEIGEKIKDERNRIVKLQDAMKTLGNFKVVLLEAEANDRDSQRELEAIRQKAMEISKLICDARRGRENSKLLENSIAMEMQEVTNSLANHKSQQQQRYNCLREKEPDVYRVVLWLKENRHLFKKQIYDPILTLINVVDPSSVKYIENHIPYRDLTAFYGEDAEDLNKFLSITDKMNLSVSGIHAAQVSEECLQPTVPRQHLRNFGLDTYLMDLFTAPGPVMNYLCNMYRLYNIPVGYRNSRQDLTAIPNFPFVKFYMGDFVYRIRTSKYGNHSKSSTSQRIMDGGLLKGHVDSAAVATLKAKLTELGAAWEKEKQCGESFAQNEMNYSHQLEELRAQKKTLTDKAVAVKNLNAKINSMEERMRVYQTPVCSVEEEEHRLSAFISHSIQKKGKMYSEVVGIVERIFDLEIENAEMCFQQYLLAKQKDKEEKALSAASSELRNLRKSLENLKSLGMKLKSDVKRAFSEAKKAVGLNPSEDIPRETTLKIEKEFQGLPNDIAELERELAREQSKLNCTNRVSPRVINDYRNREKVIGETKEAIAAKETELKELESNIENIRDQWLPAMESLIEKISMNFSRYFQSLGCAGEITLDKTDNPNDYHKYGISIKVKFRDDEPLNQLSHAHHSGGECSVSTILFMLSLQELTEVPFRCVDEINQGMDSMNERSVFDLIVKSSCSKKKSQYFLITPKLLQGLDYPPEMEIAIIQNGYTQPNLDF